MKALVRRADETETSFMFMGVIWKFVWVLPGMIAVSPIITEYYLLLFLSSVYVAFPSVDGKLVVYCF